MSLPGATTAARTSRRATSDASDATHPIGPSVPAILDHRVFEFILSTSGVEPRAGLPRFDLPKVWGVQKVTGRPLNAVIPGESATPAEARAPDRVRKAGRSG